MLHRTTGFCHILRTHMPVAFTVATCRSLRLRYYHPPACGYGSPRLPRSFVYGSLRFGYRSSYRLPFTPRLHLPIWIGCYLPDLDATAFTIPVTAHIAVTVRYTTTTLHGYVGYTLPHIVVYCRCTVTLPLPGCPVSFTRVATLPAVVVYWFLRSCHVGFCHRGSHYSLRYALVLVTYACIRTLTPALRVPRTGGSFCRSLR